MTIRGLEVAAKELAGKSKSSSELGFGRRSQVDPGVVPGSTRQREVRGIERSLQKVAGHDRRASLRGCRGRR
jgi:hypothetical protein